MPKRVLILGAGGQLGIALGEAFRFGHEAVEAVHRSPGPGQRTVELTDGTNLTRLLDEVRPEWILTAAAFCHVDRCETEPELCRRVNVEGPGTIAQWASSQGAVVVYYSTDHVFDGTLPRYSEEDRVHPLNAYASSKAQGEEVLRKRLPNDHLILRTCGLYGPDPGRKNFVIRLADQIRSGKRVRVPSDQWGAPTLTQDLARVTRFLLEKGLRGTYHATGPEFLPRMEFARRICEAFDLDPHLLVAVETCRMGQVAPRPLRVRLSTKRLEATGAPPMRSPRVGLSLLRKWLLKEVA